jgi:hypothetical protein
MCFDARTSFITFIIGTIFSLILYKSSNNKYVKVISIAWFFVVFMQFFEGLSWLSKDNNNIELSNFSTYFACIVNFIQPIILLIGLIYITDNKNGRNSLLALLIIYIIILFYRLQTLSLDKPLYHQVESCGHLDYYWWGNFRIGSYTYFIAFIVGLLYIKPIKLGIIIILYLLLSYMISLKIYPCGKSSIWCWSTAFGPIFTLFLIKSMKL